MKKRYLFIGGLTVLCVASSALALAACDNTVPEEQVPTITERIRYTEKTNPYAELTWEQYANIDDWAKKQTESPVYYQFEGSYSEAYQGNYSRDYLYMNCYEDGSVHGMVRNTANGNRIEDYLGYWTNVNSRGKENLVLHILSYNGGEYNMGMYDVVCDMQTGGYYDFASNIAISKWGNQRTMSISGYRYSPVESLTIETSEASSGCIIGDKMNYSGLVVKVNRQNGKSIAIDEESYTDPTCRVKFTGFNSAEAGDSEVTVSYVNTEISATYTVKVMGVTDIELNATEVIKEYKVGDKIDTTGLVITATREDGVKTELGVDKCEVSCSGEAGDEVPVKVSFTKGETPIEKSYNVKISPIVLTGKVNEKDATLKLTTVEKCEYTVGSDKYDLNYSKSNLNGATYCNLSKPDGSSISAEVWDAMEKNFVIDVEEGTLKVSKMVVYTIPDSGDGSTPGTPRYENEPMPGIGGGTEIRTLVIDESAGTATISYKYWYAGQTDTFVCRYTIQDGIVTLTELIDRKVGGSGAQFANLHKTWKINEDGTATKYTPAA